MLRSLSHYFGGFLLLILFTLTNFKPANAQLLPVDQPEQDACDALILCGNSFTTPYSYQGNGLTNDLTTTPCGSGEDNAMWIRLNVNTAGIIVFTISPISYDDDYDFAVLDITNTPCDSIGYSNVVRCNFDNNYPGTNVNGVVGLNTTSTTNNVGSGAYGPSFCTQITANAGDVYLIMINNFGNYVSGGTSQGFTIDFTGTTATFNQPEPSHFQSIVPRCDKSDSVTIKLTSDVLCSSIASDGSDFYLTPSASIQSAHGVGCSGSNGYTDSVTVVFSQSLPNGDYYIRAKVGTDNNTLANLCNVQLPMPDSLKFHSGRDPIGILSLDTPRCQTLTIHLAAPVSCDSIVSNGSDFEVTGPSSVSVGSAAGVGCTNGFTQTIEVHLAQPIAVDGDYFLKVKTGSDGNTFGDTCGRIVLSGDSMPFTVRSYNGLLIAHPDTSACPGIVQLYPENHGTPPAGGFQYTWSPSAGMPNPNVSNPYVLIDSGYHKFIAATVDKNGCYLRDSVIVMGFLPPTALYSYSLGLGCKGDTVHFHNETINGNQYLWRFGSANLTDTATNVDHVYPDAGSYSVTLIAKNDHCTDSTMQLISLGHPLAADFSVSDDTICQGTQVHFTNHSTITATSNPTADYQWDFGDGSASNLLNPSFTYNNSGAYTVRLIVNDSIPCYDTATHVIIVDSISGLKVSVSDTPICKGDKIIFNAGYLDGGLVYSRWNFGDSPDTVMGQNVISHAYDQAGVYEVSLNNHYRVCPDTGLSFFVRVKDVPVINIGSDTSLCLDGDPLVIKDLVNEGNPAASWLWSTGETSSSISISHPGHYWAKVTIDYCSATDDIEVKKDCYMDVPNSFTPNGDGTNDYFLPRQLLSEGVVGFHMSIFNRWGEKVFETTNRNGRGWDGKLNGKDQPVGVYIYMIDAIYKNGRTESYKGNLTLLR